MILRWRLREIMSQHRIKGKDLADKLGKHPNSITNLRGDEIPALGSKQYEELIIAINQLRKIGSKRIHFSELFDFQFEPQDIRDHHLYIDNDEFNHLNLEDYVIEELELGDIKQLTPKMRKILKQFQAGKSNLNEHQQTH